MDRSICQVDKGWEHVGIASRAVNLVQLGCIPQRQDRAHELSEAFLPYSVRRRTTTCGPLASYKHERDVGLCHNVRESVSWNFKK